MESEPRCSSHIDYGLVKGLYVCAQSLAQNLIPFQRRFSMKNLKFILLFAVLSLAAVSAPLTSANNSGPSSNGEFSFSLEDGAARLMQFHARKNSDGSTKGELTYADPTTLPESEDGLGASGLFAKASIDCLVIEGNKAVMSGEITEASVGDY